MEDTFNLKKIIVGLDLSQMDEALIKFTGYIARMMDSDKIHFVHVASDPDLPDEIKEKYPDLQAPVDKTIEHTIKEAVKDHFQGPENCDVLVEVLKGNPSDKILKLTKQKDVDMVIVGRKIGLKGGGVLTSKIAKVALRSVLIVPEILPKVMDRILVPVDFSEHSLLALKQAIKIKETSSISMEIKCQHVYRLPTGWHSTGKSKKEFADIMRGHAEKDYNKFVKQLDEKYWNIPCVFTQDDNRDPIAEIYQQAIREQADLIVLGSKGRTAAASILLGSIAERLANYDKNIPLLIVKNKNENINFLQALLRI